MFLNYPLITIKDLHTKHNGILGYRRMTLNLNRWLETCYNKKRIRRLMQMLVVQAVIRCYYCTKASYKNIEDSLLNQ